MQENKHSSLAVCPLAVWSFSFLVSAKLNVVLMFRRTELRECAQCRILVVVVCLKKKGVRLRRQSLFSKPVCMEYFKKVGPWVRGALENTENTTNVNIWIKSIWCNSISPRLGRCWPKTWYPADGQWGTTTSGTAGFPSAWRGPILSPIRNWLVYWSIPPPIIFLSSQLPSPLFHW